METMRDVIVAEVVDSNRLIVEITPEGMRIPVRCYEIGHRVVVGDSIDLHSHGGYSLELDRDALV